MCAKNEYKQKKKLYLKNTIEYLKYSYKFTTEYNCGIKWPIHSLFASKQINQTNLIWYMPSSKDKCW